MLTCLLDAFTLVIPDNERWYIRVLQRSFDRIADPVLKNEVANFIRQEALHGVAHKGYWESLEREGLPVSGFIRCLDLTLYKFLERITPHRVQIAIVSVIEHINGFLGHIFLTHQLLRDADPQMRLLFEWHFAEEIEHKAVAFDALAAVYPGYLTRLLGALMGFFLTYSVLATTTVWLLVRRGVLLRRQTWRDLRQFLREDGVGLDIVYHTMRYFHPSFHPWEEDDYFLAKPILDRFDGKLLRIPESADVGAPTRLT